MAITKTKIQIKNQSDKKSVAKKADVVQTEQDVRKIAVIVTGGKQYLVKVGDKILVEKIDQEGEIVLDDILHGGKVTIKVISNLKSDKIIVRKFKNKTRYIRTKGHRQNLSNIEILKIS